MSLPLSCTNRALPGPSMSLDTPTWSRGFPSVELQTLFEALPTLPRWRPRPRHLGQSLLRCLQYTTKETGSAATRSEQNLVFSKLPSLARCLIMCICTLHLNSYFGYFSVVPISTFPGEPAATNVAKVQVIHDL